MISESSYWKATLHKHVKLLHAKRRQRLWRDSSFSLVEQSVMLSCYIVRKLAESHKISMAKYQAPLPLQSFNTRGKKIDLLNSHKLQELYHLSAPKPISKPLSYIANQLIHSFVFYSLLEEQRQLWGFAFNSDRSKDAVLYSIELQPLLAAFATCADSYISSATYLRLPSGTIDVTVDDYEALHED